LLLNPVDKNKKGALEFAVDEQFIEALNQIQENNYEQELKAQGIKDILKLAVVGYKKDVWVRESE